MTDTPHIGPRERAYLASKQKAKKADPKKVAQVEAAEAADPEVKAQVDLAGGAEAVAEAEQ